ncbi:hypothetical protein BASA62_009454 [Batrachochytrium salamandrivorans]|nr:hypothetical protein BASA62_009454 [Batrachochytrium salamandrivorans]
MTSSGCGVRTARIERTASGDSSVRQRGFPSMNTTRRSKIMSAMPSLQQQLIIAASVMGLAALAVVPMVFSLRAPMVAQGDCICLVLCISVVAAVVEFVNRMGTATIWQICSFRTKKGPTIGAREGTTLGVKCQDVGCLA